MDILCSYQEDLVCLKIVEERNPETRKAYPAWACTSEEMATGRHQQGHRRQYLQVRSESRNRHLLGGWADEPASTV